MTNAASFASAALNSVSQPTSASNSAGSAAGTTSENSPFSALFGSSMQQASNLETQAQSTVMDLLRGGGTEVHDAMIATQQSELTFELALQVRNKAVSAYQQMMQMQF